MVLNHIFKEKLVEVGQTGFIYQKKDDILYKAKCYYWNLRQSREFRKGREIPQFEWQYCGADLVNLTNPIVYAFQTFRFADGKYITDNLCISTETPPNKISGLDTLFLKEEDDDKALRLFERAGYKVDRVMEARAYYSERVMAV